MRGSVSEVMRWRARCGERWMSVFGRSILRIMIAWSTLAASAGRWGTSCTVSRSDTSRDAPATISSPRRVRSSRAVATSALSAPSATPVVSAMSTISQRTPPARAASTRRAISGALASSSVPRSSTWCTTSSRRCSRTASAPGRTTARSDCEVNMPGLYPLDLRGSPPRHAARANRTRRRENCPMPVPLFDTRTPLEPLRARLQERLLAVADSGHFILGPEVAAFEAEFVAYVGTEYAIGVANGTDAIVLLLRALGVGPGDDVVVPAFTFYASAEAIALCGARPVFCDVDPDTFCVTADTVHAALTPRTRAVLAVHLFGNVAPIGEIEALGVPVLEDAAQAAGSKVDGGPRPGALGTGATFSFFPSKNLGCFGDGGAVTTDDPDLAARVRMLRFHGSHDKETFELVGHNSRLDELQAAVLRVLLPHLDDWCDGRRAGARAYAEAGLGDLAALPEPTP